MKFLVTGGGGFLGSAIIKRLIKREYEVRSFSRAYYPNLESMGVEQIQGDISDGEAVESACQGVECVFHVAAKPGIWGKYSEFYNTNTLGTENVIRACKKYGVCRLIYTSSPSVIFDGNPMEGVDESVPYPKAYAAHYPKTKAAAEQMVIAAASQGLMTITLRPHLIWGPGDNHLVPRILARAKSLIRVGDGKNLVDTIYIDNAADAHIQAADSIKQNAGLSGKTYFISQGAPIPLWDMVNAILKAGGFPPVQRSISHKTAWKIGAVLEAIYTLFHIKSEPRMTRFLSDELATSHWFNISAAKKDLGYAPLVSTEQGLDNLEKWLKYNEYE